MDKTVALCLTALLLLAGCLDSASEEDIEELVNIAGCDDKNSLNYDEKVTEENDAEANSALCASEELIEQALLDFLTFMDEGPDMSNINSTVGYSMDISEVYEGATWTYLETIIITPTGYSESIDDNYGEEFWTESIVASGSQVQYVTTDSDGNTMEVRMTHALTFEEFFAAMMSADDDMDMEDMDDMDDMDMTEDDGAEGRQGDGTDSMQDNDTSTSDDDTANQDDSSTSDEEILMVCYDMDNHMVFDQAQTQEECEDAGFMWTEMQLDDGDDAPTPEELLEMADIDGDEKISYEEWMTFMESQLWDEIDEMGGEVPQEFVDMTNGIVSKAFNESDLDSSLYIEMEEIVGLIYNVDMAFDSMENDMNDMDDDMDMEEFNDLVEDIEEDEDPEFKDYTEDLGSDSITFTGFEVTTEGITFKGTVTLEGLVNLGTIEIYTSTDFAITGFHLMDMEEENNWVKFKLITSGDAEAIDESVTHYALPFYLMDITEYDDEDREDDVWTFHRDLQSCDEDGDSLINLQEFDECVAMDLLNDGFDSSTEGMHLEEVFSMSDMDSNGYLNQSEFDYLSLMMDKDDDDNAIEEMDQENCEDDGGDWIIDEMEDDGTMMEAHCHDNHDNDREEGEEGEDLQMLLVVGMEGLEGSLSDYSFTLAQCDMADESECIGDVYSVLLNDVVVTQESMMTGQLYPVSFMDADSSGTISTGDMIIVDHNQLDELNLSWDTQRLHSEEADGYSDENPMMPGFTGFLATIGLLGAALIRRE